MLRWVNRHTAKSILVLGFCVSLILQMFGIAYMGMTMQPDGKMINCPFMGKAAICNMSPLEHVATLQNMLAATPQQSGTAVLLLLLLSLVFFGFVIFSGTALDTGPGHRFLEYLRREPRIFDPLQLAFARGIIHSKVF